MFIQTKDGYIAPGLLIAIDEKYEDTAVDAHYRTSLIIAAMDHAVKYHKLPTGAIFHWDGGSTYMSKEYSNYLAGHQIRQSAGKT